MAPLYVLHTNNNRHDKYIMEMMPFKSFKNLPFMHCQLNAIAKMLIHAFFPAIMNFSISGLLVFYFYKSRHHGEEPDV